MYGCVDLCPVCNFILTGKGNTYMGLLAFAICMPKEVKVVASQQQVGLKTRNYLETDKRLWPIRERGTKNEI